MNSVYLEVYSNLEDFQKASIIRLPLISVITYSIHRFCSPETVSLKLVVSPEVSLENTLLLEVSDGFDFVDKEEVPWQVASCVYPVALYDDTVITGLCAVARHICKYRSSQPFHQEHEEGLLGFRKSCLQAPNEVSIWTKFCEVELTKTVSEVLNSEDMTAIPKNLARFENHLSKPVKVHNVYKIAREMKKVQLVELSANNTETSSATNFSKKEKDGARVPKTRKWKSNVKKELEVDCAAKVEQLEIGHHFAEGPFLTLADLILMPSYHILMQMLGPSNIETILPLTIKWYRNIMDTPELAPFTSILKGIKCNNVKIKELILPSTEDVSLYKCDPKRHNPKKRLFTKEDDIENALHVLTEDMELVLSNNDVRHGIDWNSIPDGANPLAGHLPDERMTRKSQQLENLALATLEIAKDGDLIVDFCSGSGHLGILIAHFLPKCTVILLENKEQSLLRARKRVHDLGLSNVYFFQCNLDFFIGKFDIGIALHACGIASDLVLDKCLKAKAKFVLCPCCYGSLHATDRLVYPRSKLFQKISIDQYLCIGHAADQTHEDHHLTARGSKCMAVIDSDRGRLAEEFGYKVTLARLKPLTCTPKNNLLIGVLP